MKKLALFVSIATLGFFGVAAASIVKPIEVMATDQEPISSVYASEEVSSSIVSSAQEVSSEAAVSSKGNILDDVTIDGKKVSELIEELKHEETRRTAIVALVIAFGGAGLFVARWVSELKKMKANAKQLLENNKAIQAFKDDSAKMIENLKAQAEEARKQAEEQVKAAQAQAQELRETLEAQAIEFDGRMKAQTEAFKEQFVQQGQALETKTTEIQSMLKQDTQERQNIRDALLIMSKSSEEYVSHGTFKAIREIFKESNDGKED